jgi:hypothetical protein
MYSVSRNVNDPASLKIDLGGYLHHQKMIALKHFYAVKYILNDLLFIISLKI